MRRIAPFFPLLLGCLMLASTASRAQSIIPPMGGHYPKMPTTTTVMSVAPNPFTVKTTLEYKLKKAGHLSIRVLDVKGREVLTLLDDHVTAGPHAIDILGKSFEASGTYYCKLTWESEPPVTVNLSFQK